MGGKLFEILKTNFSKKNFPQKNIFFQKKKKKNTFFQKKKKKNTFFQKT